MSRCGNRGDIYRASAMPAVINSMLRLIILSLSAVAGVALARDFNHRGGELTGHRQLWEASHFTQDEALSALMFVMVAMVVIGSVSSGRSQIRHAVTPNNQLYTPPAKEKIKRKPTAASEHGLLVDMESLGKGVQQHFNLGTANTSAGPRSQFMSDKAFLVRVNIPDGDDLDAIGADDPARLPPEPTTRPIYLWCKEDGAHSFTMATDSNGCLQLYNENLHTWSHTTRYQARLKADGKLGDFELLDEGIFCDGQHTKVVATFNCAEDRDTTIETTPPPEANESRRLH